MPDIGYYLKALGNTILRERIRQRVIEETDRIEFLPFADGDDGDVIYVGTWAQLVEAEKAGRALPRNIFVSCRQREPYLPECPGSNVVESSLDIAELHHRLGEVAANYRKWKKIFCCGDGAATSRELVKAAADISGSSIFVMNAGYQVDFFELRGKMDDAFSKKLAEEQYMSLGEIGRIFENPEVLWTRDYACIPQISDGGRMSCHVKRLQEQGVVIGSVLAVSPQSAPADMETLLDCLGAALMKNGIHVDLRFTPSKSRVQRILGTILENRSADSTEFFHLLRGGAEFAPGTGYVVTITELENDAVVSYAEIMKKLSILLTDAFSVVYDGRIITIVSGVPVGPRNYGAIFRSGSEEETKKMLRERGAYMEIGTPTSKCDRLFTMYITALYMLNISRRMEENTESRMFYEKDNKAFLVMALGVERFFEIVGHEDGAYLNSPNIMELYRYDAANRQNLIQVLYQYLLSGCDIQKTSAAVYMHRNTVKNKLDKIQELVGMDFSDGAENTKYLFGLLMIRYCEKCLGLDYRYETYAKFKRR